jgi:hypothetical protein
LNSDELVAAIWGFNYAHNFDLNVDLHSIDVDDVAPPIAKLDDAKGHTLLLFNVLLDYFFIYFGVNYIIGI